MGGGSFWVTITQTAPTAEQSLKPDQHRISLARTISSAVCAAQKWMVNNMNITEAKQVLSGLLDAFDQDEHGDYFYEHGWAVCEALIYTMSAFDCQTRHGKWIKYLDFWRKCSECNETWHEQWILGKHLRYCPGCGARMEGE